MAEKMTVVVVGIDDGPQSLAAFHRALKVFPKESTQFLLAHVRPDDTLRYGVDQMYYDEDDWARMEATRKELSTKVIAYFRGKAEDAGVKHQEAELQGDPKEQLCNFCAVYKADVLVLGAKARDNIEGALVDRVAHHCLHHAPCTVMVERVWRVVGEVKVPWYLAKK